MPFQTSRMLSIQRQGAEFALVELANHFGRSLPVKLPKLWEAIVGPLQDIKKGGPFGKKCVRCSLNSFVRLLWRVAAILRSVRSLQSLKKAASIMYQWRFPFFTPLVVWFELAIFLLNYQRNALNFVIDVHSPKSNISHLLPDWTCVWCLLCFLFTKMRRNLLVSILKPRIWCTVYKFLKYLYLRYTRNYYQR